MKKTVLIASVAAFGLAAPVFAQDVTAFESADTDMSGGVTLEEVQAIAPDVTSDGFDAYDADADGALNQDEFETWQMANPEPAEEPEAETEEEATESPYRG